MSNHQSSLRTTLLLVALSWLVTSACAATEGSPAHDDSAALQAILDRGEDLLLEPARVYTVTTTLRYKSPGQRIGTREANSPKDFATIRAAAGTLVTLVDASGISGATLERVILDGNRRSLEPTAGKIPALPFTAWGRAGGDRQLVQKCLIFDARCGGGWGAIHVNEGATDIRVEDNVIIGTGTDCRGNGRAEAERAFGWGDGISTASRNTVVRNNLILDATDDGIMVQGAPGSIIEDNLISAISREMLGGIVLIDPAAQVASPDHPGRYDYKSVVVRRNRIESLGERIQIGIPMGGVCWNQKLAGKILWGATVTDNSLGGEAFGYGFVADAIDGFVVTGNKSEATHSGHGDGPRGDRPDPAKAFLYNPAGVGSSTLQTEFSPAERHIHSLLRCWPPPADPLGYRIATYTDEELPAIVRAAYWEILGRDIDPTRLQSWMAWMREKPTNADQLRLAIAASETDGPKLSGLGELQQWRLDRWRVGLLRSWEACSSADRSNWPRAENLYKTTWRELKTIR